MHAKIWSIHTYLTTDQRTSFCQDHPWNHHHCLLNLCYYCNKPSYQHDNSRHDQSSNDQEGTNCIFHFLCKSQIDGGKNNTFLIIILSTKQKIANSNMLHLVQSLRANQQPNYSKCNLPLVTFCHPT
jgi:hypothetical protein